MHLQEIPALPFSLDAKSASEWLDQLPIANIRECSRLFFPVVQTLSIYPMEPGLRYEILEKCHPVVLGIARRIQPHFMDKVFPLDGKARKIAGLAWRFHLEAAQGYRQIMEAEEYTQSLGVDECVTLLCRALEHLAQALLRAAQVYEVPSSALGASLEKLYQIAHTQGLLGETTAPGEREKTASARSWFTRIAMFRLAAPGRLAQANIQRLFDRLSLIPGMDEAGLEDGGGRTVFCFEPNDVQLLVPALPTSPPPLSGLPFFSAERALSALRAPPVVETTEREDHWARVLFRLGERLPCQDRIGGRRVRMTLGFDAIMAMFRNMDARRSVTGQGSGTWSSLANLELAPLDKPSAPASIQTPAFVRKTLADAVRASETGGEMRTIEVIPADLPGFYLIDSGRWILRTGLLVCLNSNDERLQLGVLRGGQIRDGRFWHSFELLGTVVRPVRIAGDKTQRDSRDALMLAEAGANPSLIIGPSKWRRDDIISLQGPGSREAVRVARLLEATGDFYQFELVV